jgi:competence protein ComEC
MTKQKSNKKRKKNTKLTKRQFYFVAVIVVLIIVFLVALTTGNGLSNINNWYDSLDSEYAVETQTESKIYTSILSGKANIILPEEFDTQNLLEVHFINVGQGDAIAINFPDGKTMLIDAGTVTTGRETIREEYTEYLEDITDNKVIEFLIVTHPDMDHYDLLSSVLDDYDVQTIYYNEYSGETYCEFIEDAKMEPSITVNEVDAESQMFTIEGDDYKVTIYACGDSAFDGAEENNSMSMICLLEYGGREILLTGDATNLTEDWFMENYYDENFDIDILKVGHHGSSSSTDSDFLEYINAEYGIISCDDGTKYGHPHEETMERLSLYGVATYRTNIQGNILLYVDMDGDFGFLCENDIAAENNTLAIDERKIAITME